MILVVGDVMTDVIVAPAGPLALGTDTPARIVARPGGSGANLACWIGHLGAVVRFAGRVGADEAAHHAAAFRAHGVEARLGVDAARPTGRIVAILSADGERSFYTDRGANLSLGPADLPESLLDGVRLLHVSGYALFAEAPREAARGLMQAARERGVAVSVDAGSAAFLAQAGRAAFLDWTRAAQTCFANAAEGAVLEAGPADFATRVVTRGAAGIEAWRGTQHASAPAPPAEQPETTGAGDAAMAGYLVAEAAGRTLPACLEAAMLAAHRAVLGLGGRPDTP